ncbi:hypothetical protein PIB30_025402 [Stylosanthes scabra]|uniref:Uncharacterized protein n=1 Tax=Stylosanthes scabra TaxID=79078 RepID=A0ABU6RAG2_9FABA|nr:hypothetical protein [Stylosanthes scabra]
MALVKGLREDTPFLKSLTKRPPKTMEEIQDRSHEYLQQEEGQTTVKTDRDKREASRKDLPREDSSRHEHSSGRSYYNPLNVSLATFLHEVSQVERIPAPRAIKKTCRGDWNAYCKYHKQNGHDTEDCRDLLEFVEKGLKKGKFREYTGRSNDRGDDRRTRQRVGSPDKSTEGKDEPKDGVARREIKMISGGLPDEGNHHPGKRPKGVNTHASLWKSCLGHCMINHLQKSHSPRKRSEEQPTL